MTSLPRLWRRRRRSCPVDTESVLAVSPLRPSPALSLALSLSHSLSPSLHLPAALSLYTCVQILLHTCMYAYLHSQISKKNTHTHKHTYTYTPEPSSHPSQVLHKLSGTARHAGSHRAVRHGARLPQARDPAQVCNTAARPPVHATALRTQPVPCA